MEAPDIFEIKIEKEDRSVRIDKLLAQKIDNLARNYLHQLFERGLVLKDNDPIAKNYRPKQGDTIKVILKKREPLSAKPQNIDIPIIYEDECLLVVNKPKGMVVHPAVGNPKDTLVNALLYHCGEGLSKIGGEIRPGLVHRLDKDTSGLLVVAKTDEAHVFLTSQLSEHKLGRIYSAVVRGNIKDDHGCVDLPIGRSLKDRKKMTVTQKNSKYAVTYYEVIKRYKDYTHVLLRLKTGRTHQIRVHMAHMGHSVAGDPVYGKGEFPQILHGQCLHAQIIEFMHPKLLKVVKFSSDLPDYFVDFLEIIR